MRVPILVALVLSAAACTTQTDIPAPAAYIAAKHPRSIRVQTRSATVRLVDCSHEFESARMRRLGSA